MTAIGDGQGRRERLPSSDGFDYAVGLQDIIDNLDDEVLVVDVGHRVKFVNLALRRRMTGAPDSPVGRHCFEVFQNRSKPCDTPLWECPLRRILQTGEKAVVVHREKLPGSGGERYVTITASPLRDQRGRITAVVELRQDVSAERQLERQVLTRFNELSSLNSISAALSASAGLDSVLNVALDNALELLGGQIGGILLLDEEKKMLCYRVHRGLSNQYVEGMCLHLEEGIAGRVAVSGQAVLVEDISTDPRAAQPGLISVEGLKAFASIPLLSKDRVVGVLNAASRQPRQFSKHDLQLLDSIGHQLGVAIERARLHDELRRRNETYRQLLRHVISAQEEERRRIARELHDETAQTLTALAFGLNTVNIMADMPEVPLGEIKEKMGKLLDLSKLASGEISKLINDLRPTLLDNLGLPAAVQNYARNYLEASGIKVAVNISGDGSRLPAELETGLFRIAQGAISNVRRHSAATNATVTGVFSENEATLVVEDDGKGFDLARVMNLGDSELPVGLLSMKERVDLIGGSLDIDSGPGRGTRVTVKVTVVRSLGDSMQPPVGSK